MCSVTPGQEFVDPIDLVIGNAAEDGGEPGLGVDAVELGGLDQGTGHAMKAENPLKAFGAVIGKALRPLKAGQGLIPVLISLQ